MMWIAAGTFVIGLVFAYLVFTLPAKRQADGHTEDLKAAKSLLDEAQKEREALKQKVADLEYQLKETQKDLEASKR